MTPNERYAERLGFEIPQGGEETIRAFQRAHLLTPDGVMGPLTYAVWLEDEAASLKERIAFGAVYLRGALAVNRAKREWLRDIVEPQTPDALLGRDRDAIRGYIGPGGLGWISEANRYTHDRCPRCGIDHPRGDFAWCGAFSAAAWRHAGLRSDVRLYFLASCARLDCLARGVPWPSGGGHERRPPATEASRIVRFDEARPGDLVMTGPEDGPDFGVHITVFESWEVPGSHARTLEGNAVGLGPRGIAPREGVCRKVRSRSEVRRVVRFAPEDFA